MRKSVNLTARRRRLLTGARPTITECESALWDFFWGRKKKGLSHFASLVKIIVSVAFFFFSCRYVLEYRGLWVSLSNLPHWLQAFWATQSTAFFLHQILRKPTNCVVWQRYVRIQTGPMNGQFDRLLRTP